MSSAVTRLSVRRAFFFFFFVAGTTYDVAANTIVNYYRNDWRERPGAKGVFLEKNHGFTLIG